MDKKIKKELKALAHHLNPVVMTGTHGLTPGVHQEIEVALEAHELIKLRVNAGDREARDAMIVDILKQHQAELIQQIGHTVTIYREASDEDDQEYDD
ncbi:MAG: ribosome assembly RNA-binding protein YhbY [Coxiella sp. (in: Bacteria)]|nr:MAG: ribosome assembly RNA-binding protein YhbY [Coxiella sp. (in: g-proteobacteria)]